MSRLLPTRPALLAALALSFAVAGHAATPPAVSVRFDHPEQFTETREVRAFARSRADLAYLDTLARYIQRRAARIVPAGQHLDLTITDVDLAGSYLPTAASPQPVRIVESRYPPRINLHFRLLDDQGRVIREGDRRLTDLTFMQDAIGIANSTDPLRYEENLLDRWLRRGVDKL